MGACCSTPVSPSASPSAAPAVVSEGAAPSPSPALSLGDCDFTIWKQPALSLSHVHACGLYIRPLGAPIHADWAPKQSQLLSSCAAFHAREFPGSRMTWSLHGPLELPVAPPAAPPRTCST